MANEPDAVDSARRAALESLFRKAYPDLRDAAYREGLTTLDNDLRLLIGAVIRNLQKYPGPDDDLEAFTKWTTVIVIDGAALLRTLHTLKGKYRDGVRKAIAKKLQGCADLGAVFPDTVDQIEADFWWKVLIKRDRWLTPGFGNDGRPPARLGTRLNAYAGDQVQGWITARLREREKFGSFEQAEYRGAKSSRKPSLSEIEARAA